MSGTGLVNINNWLCKTERMDEPQWPADMMKTGDPARVICETDLKKRTPICVKALDVFITIQIFFIIWRTAIKTGSQTGEKGGA